MSSRTFSRAIAWFVPVIMITALGCGGSGSSETPPPVEGIQPKPDAPFGGLGNPYNEPEKKAGTRKKG